MKQKEMEASSAFTGRLPRGCVLCRSGSKLVLLTTGKCYSGCYYCPLSKKKRGKAVIYADEMMVKDDQDILEEARLIRARGAGITGGDPLLELERVLHCIRLLKASFGDRFHIHLYTATIDAQAYRRLQDAGLDELRVHPSVKVWSAMRRSGLSEALKGLSMKIGIEVPALPGEEKGLRDLLRYADSLHLDFINLNELEFSETNYRALLKHGLETKDDISSAAKGSEELALRLMRMKVKIPVHYCSSAFKDSVQLRRRITRRAKSVARSGDVITNDGTLLKGVIEGKGARQAALLLKEVFDVPAKLMHFDEEKKRLEVAPWVLEEIAGKLPFASFIVEEYPTADRLEVERTPLKGKKDREKRPQKRKMDQDQGIMPL